MQNNISPRGRVAPLLDLNKKPRGGRVPPVAPLLDLNGVCFIARVVWLGLFLTGLGCSGGSGHY